MKVETKYNVGDTLWAASTTMTEEKIPCPDCNGEKVWKVTTPAGETFDVPCSTCFQLLDAAGYIIRRSVGPYVYSLKVTGVEVRTEGAVQKVLYWSNGNGRYETDLFLNYDDAYRLATFLAKQRQQENDENYFHTYFVEKKKGRVRNIRRKS